MYKVMIAEDEDIIRKGLVYTVNWAAMDCAVIAEAANGVEGIEAIRQHSPDIIVVDINMPIKDGLEMIRETYEDYDYAAIILSGYSNFEYAQQAIAFGVLGYLSKPLNKNEFEAAIIRAKKERDVQSLVQQSRIQKSAMREIDLFREMIQAGAEEDSIVHEMLAFIYQNYAEKIQMKDIVRKLNYSETFLNKKFKDAVGTTYIEYLNRYRIQKSIELMNETDLSIQDIAWQCGIQDYKYFRTVFKKYVGYSPKEYRIVIEGK